MKRMALALTLALGGVAAADPASTAPTYELHPGEPPHEILHGGPSGMWTSNIPVGNRKAYRWRLLGIGGGIAGIMGLIMIRLVKRANKVPRARIVVVPPREKREPQLDAP